MNLVKRAFHRPAPDKHALGKPAVDKHAIAVLVVLVAMLPAWAQSATPPAIAGGEPAPGAPRLPAGRAAEPRIDALFSNWDRNHDGQLSRQEFHDGYLGVRRAGEMQARLRGQFATVDANDNHAIDPAEYGGLLLVRNAGRNAPQMSIFDGNHDGKLQFGEYLKLVRTLAPPDTGKDVPK
jgi:hypothetical protein